MAKVEFAEVDPKLMADAAADIDRHADEMARSVIASDGDHGGELTVANVKAALLMHLMTHFHEGRVQLAYMHATLQEQETEATLSLLVPAKPGKVN